jgi:hypothetical protein
VGWPEAQDFSSQLLVPSGRRQFESLRVSFQWCTVMIDSMTCFETVKYYRRCLLELAKPKPFQNDTKKSFQKVFLLFLSDFHVFLEAWYI